jgi:hypothetical protein
MLDDLVNVKATKVESWSLHVLVEARLPGRDR